MNKHSIITAIVIVIIAIPFPHSSTTQISGFEFDKMMNAEDLSCD